MDDTISRQAAIDDIRTMIPKDVRLDIKWIEMWLKQLPSAQRWIPCSERLPKVREWVLCQCRAGIMDVLRLTEDGNWNKNYPHAEYMSGFVIAWMPLPKPWEGEEYGTSRTMLPKKSLC